MRKKMILVAALSVGIAGVAQGQIFFATNNLAAPNGYTDGGDQLITFDFFEAWRSWSPIGEIVDQSGLSRRGIGGLDFNGDGSILYAADSFGAAPGEIMTIDPATAQATVIGRAPAAMHDLAWDPLTNDLYGVDGSGNLYNGLDNPENATLIGNFGLDTHELGLGFDSRGNMYIHDLQPDRIYSTIYVADAGNLTTLAELHIVDFNAEFSQGLFVDWHTTDSGFHGAMNTNGVSRPLSSETHLFGTLVTGGGYSLDGSRFSTDNRTGLPQVQVGDLTRPIPTPGSLALLALGGLAAARRRR